MKKYLIVLAAVLAVLFCAFSASAAVVESGKCGGSVTWSLEDDGTLTISGTGDMEDYTGASPSPWFDYRKSYIKSIVIESGVTSIGAHAFHGCQSKELTSVTIPDGVTKIGEGAFMACNNLPVITIPGSVTEIGESAFDSCCSLAGVTIHAGVTSIAKKAFYNCAALTSVTIPEGVTSIGEEAFAGCNDLAAVSIPGTVTSIDTMAFSNCLSLTEITIPANVESIGSDPFYDCTSLTGIILQGGRDQYSMVGSSLPENIDIVIASGSCGTNVTYEMTAAGKLIITGSGDMADFDDENNAAPWYGEGLGKVYSVVIDSSVTSIGSKAFISCTGMTGVTFNENSCLERIGEGAFYNCSNLTEITIPAGVKTIGISAFGGCYELRSVTFAEGSRLTTIEQAVFSDCRQLKNITIPAGVTSIGNFAFASCNQLTNITFSAGVTVIGERAFQNCYELSSVTFAEGSRLTTVGNYAFYIDVNGKQYDCLASITLPAEVTDIGINAFGNRTRTLRSVTLPANAKYDSTSFPSGCDLTYAGNCGANGGNLTYTLTLKSKMNVDTGVQTVTGVLTVTGSGAMMNYRSAEAVPWYGKSITQVTLPDGMTSIGDYAFNGCAGLTAVTIPQTVTTIGTSAFANTGITRVEFSGESRLTSIGSGAFPAAAKIYSIAPSAGLKTVLGAENIIIADGSWGSNGCYVLHADSVLTITGSGEMGEFEMDEPYRAPWYGLGEKTGSIVIGSGVTTIGDYAFFADNNHGDGFIDLTSVTIGSDVTRIGKYAFQNCSSLSNVTFADGSRLEEIYTEAFSCTGLSSSLTFPDTLKSIEKQAFANTGLSSVTIPDTMEDLDSDAFPSGCAINYKGSCGEGVTYLLTADGELIISKTGTGSGAMDSSLPWSTKAGSITSVAINSGVTGISARAFEDCTGLTDVTLSDGMTDIGDYAFSGCTGLTAITLPAGTTDIGEYAFWGCTGLRRIAIPNDNASIGDNAFDGCAEDLTFVCTLNSSTMKNVMDCTGKAVYVEDGYCVYCCSSTELKLTDCVYWGSMSFDIPAGVTSIGENAFSGCNLTGLSIPGSVTAIGDNAFPESTIITYNGTKAQWMQIANGRFSNNEMIFLVVVVTLDLKADDTDYRGETVQNCDRGQTLTLPASIHKDGWSFLGWEYNGSIVTEVTPTEDITVNAGWQISIDGMSTLTLPASLTTIKANALSGVAAQVIILPDGCTDINGTAFNNCEKLQYIVVPDGISIETVFEGCADTIHFLRKVQDGHTVRYIFVR